jgi:hypothetical protein
MKLKMMGRRERRVKRLLGQVIELTTSDGFHHGRAQGPSEYTYTPLLKHSLYHTRNYA